MKLTIAKMPKHAAVLNCIGGKLLFNLTILVLPVNQPNITVQAITRTTKLTIVCAFL
jgi:hypothetical protein